MTNKRFIPFGLSALLFLGGCQDKDFMNVVHEKARNPILNCRCPAGFDPNPAADGCHRELKADPTGTGGALIEIGDVAGSYLSWSAYFADATGTNEWPLAFEPNAAATDAKGALLPEAKVPSIPFWRDRVMSANRISIRSDPYIWHTKTVCVDIPDARTYSIFVGADNNWNMRIDGLDYAKCTGDYCFTDARFISQNFRSGKHLVEMKYLDQGAYGALWFEVYNQSLASLQSATRESDLNVLFSTKSLVGQHWDFDGEVCPPGYAYDVCANDHKCTKLEKAECL